ncbi:MAG: hypothetical protein AAGI71_11760 [Bacteroidota bacterium]
MSPEEYQRIKDEEKAHLRALKKMKARVRELDKKRKISATMASLTTSAADLLRANAESLERLAMETLRHEARTEVALEEEALRTEAARPAPGTVTPEDEEALQKAKALDLVRQFKMEMGVPQRERTIGRADSDDEAAVEAPPPTDTSPRAAAAEKPPEKTIGRMRR